MTEATDPKAVVKETRSKMENSLEATRKEFHNLRTGRASIALVENIQVDYYGTPTPMKQVAAISTPDAKTIAIQPWDASAMEEAEKAILKSDLGLTPTNDGQVIRIIIPALTEERRNDLSKLIKKIAEEGRVSVRHARQEGIEQIKKLEKSKDISEDESKTFQKEVQKVTDEFVKLVDEALQKKESEIHEI